MALVNPNSPASKVYTHQRKIYINHKLDSAALAADSLDISAVFTFTLTTALTAILEQTAKYILFPGAVLFNGMRMLLAWRDVALHRGEKSLIKNYVLGALIESVAFVGISVAVLGAFIATAIFANITPVIFAAVMGFKALSNFARVSFALYEFATARTAAEQLVYQKQMFTLAAAATASLFAGVAVLGAMIYMQHLLSIFGIAAGFIGLSVAAYKWQAAKNPPPPCEDIISGATQVVENNQIKDFPSQNTKSPAPDSTYIVGKIMDLSAPFSSSSNLEIRTESSEPGLPPTHAQQQPEIPESTAKDTVCTVGTVDRRVQ